MQKGLKTMWSAADLLEEGKGVLRLAPTWVPRAFCRPGRRLRLHPEDLYKKGLEKGGIDERWFSSTTWAENGPGTPEDEGLSYAVSADGKRRVLLREAVEELKGQLIGRELWEKYGRWPMFSKFFDNAGPLPHHIHHQEEHARRVGASGKPEMYFFPAQYNNYGAEFPYTFFGLRPGVRKEQVLKCLENFAAGDNRLLELSQAYAMALDTGWDVPPGVLHAPASLCTYEPQFASDVYAMYQSVLPGGQCVAEELLWKNCPPEERGNFRYLLDVIDWERNVDPDFAAHRFMAPQVIRSNEEETEEWICYRCDTVSAKRLTVQPGRRVLVRDEAAYGLILIQGRGSLNQWPLETPTLIRYGQLTSDEYFVSEKAAREGVWVENVSAVEPLVMLKHFAENPERDCWAEKALGGTKGDGSL